MIEKFYGYVEIHCIFLQYALLESRGLDELLKLEKDGHNYRFYNSYAVQS